MSGMNLMHEPTSYIHGGNTCYIVGIMLRLTNNESMRGMRTLCLRLQSADIVATECFCERAFINA